MDVADVACGFHAGDASTMIRTVRLAKQHGVRVGAHPGLPDLSGFGRRRMDIDPDDMYAMVLYQAGALQAILAAEGMLLSHVKPHGELYFYVQRDPKIREAVVGAVRALGVPLYSLPTEAMLETCRRLGVMLVPEFYPDIDYDAEGQLVPVTSSKPVTPDLIRKRIDDLATYGLITTSAGTTIRLDGFGRGSFTVCIHSDLSGSLGNVLGAREAVESMLKRDQEPILGLAA